MKIGIFGAGGFGREVLPEVRYAYPDADIKFVVDKNSGSNTCINGIETLSLDTAIEQKRSIVLAVGDGSTRKRISERLQSECIELLSIKAKNVVMYDEVNIGIGSVICSGSIITSNVEIGICFQCNLFSYVAHDCVVGNFVTLAPRVSCNGNVIIEDEVYIGTGALIRQGSKNSPLVIGRGSIVGMGAVVTKDVPPGCTVVGNPARILNKSGS